MNELQLSSYDYALPEELIAQEPPEKRGQSRLLVLDSATGNVQHRIFNAILEYLNPGDCLVLNRTKVIPARLYGRKETGGKAEVLFLTFGNDSDEVLALVRPFIPAGKKIIFHDGFYATVKGKTELGETILTLSGPNLNEVLGKYGIMPLPHYIKRPTDTAELLNQTDKERYQTVYAKENGSIAAPTAGLHFTEEIIKSIHAKGISVVEVILHVGWGTFRPITSQDITQHNMLPEYYEISASAVKEINACYLRKGSIVAVGTTSVRALESAYAEALPDRLPDGPLSGKTSLFIYPGYSFKIISRLLTNFHLPCSTPLFMACAFAGREKIFGAYDTAISEKYRFYSYGDAMLIL